MRRITKLSFAGFCSIAMIAAAFAQDAAKPKPLVAIKAAHLIDGNQTLSFRMASSLLMEKKLLRLAQGSRFLREQE
jgi:hypothetical protein